MNDKLFRRTKYFQKKRKGVWVNSYITYYMWNLAAFVFCLSEYNFEEDETSKTKLILEEDSYYKESFINILFPRILHPPKISLKIQDERRL